MLNKALRSPWISAAVHGALWALLVLVIGGMGSRVPQFRESAARPIASEMPPAVKRLENLFTTEQPPRQVFNTAALNPFSTTHFLSPSKPAPPPATTRRIELTYQGYYRVADGPHRVLLKLGDSLMDVPLGGMVLSNYCVAAATPGTLTLTNQRAQTNQFTLNTQKAIEVPL